MAVNLNKNRDAIIAAWKDVLDDKTSTDWALFGYEGLSNDLKVVSKGDGGIEELKDELNSGQIMYAFLKVMDPKTSLPKSVLINWQGEGAPLVRKGTCANHIRDLTNILRGIHVTINARNDEEVDPDVVIEKVMKSTGSAYSFKERIGDVDRQTAPVGTTYQRVIPKNEINITERDKFWQKEEEEEKRRLAEEKRKQEALRAQVEKERLEREAQVTQGRESPERTSTRNDSVREEAEQLIKMRNFDPRSVFEKNTSVGQINSRKSSLQTPGDSKILISDVCNSWPIPEDPKINETPTLESAPIIEALSDHRLDGLASQNQREENPAAVLNDHPVQRSQEAPLKEEQPFVEDFNGTDYLDLENLGLRAEALYDYQAADETEISFDPGDIITHIDQIDTGWWQGLAPDGTFGLFPANYVQLLD